MSRALTEEQKEKRFWDRVDINLNGCWEWTKAVSASGYGNYYNLGAHKYAYSVIYGPIPNGLVVMHSCDNKKCCRPDHLSIGTHKENSIDMRAKGRNSVFYGEKHGRHKLTDGQVIEIKQSYVGGNRYNPGNAEELAKKFSVHKEYIRSLAYGKARQDLNQWLAQSGIEA